MNTIALVLFMQENIDKVTEISQNFLKRKCISLDEYIQYISTPRNRGDELALHLLCIMQGVYYCLITKTGIHYSFLRNKVCQDTIKKAMKSPPHHIDFNESLSGQISA